MWDYQFHFRDALQWHATEVLKELGVPDAKVECLLVGARIPGHEVRNDVCVEPEDGKWSLDLFSSVVDMAEKEIEDSPQVILTNADDRMRREWREEEYRLAVGRAVLKSLGSYDSEHRVRSFARSGWKVGDYIVLPVIQVMEPLFEGFRPLQEPIRDGVLTAYPSLVHAAIGGTLEKAREELQRPDPGRDFIFRRLSSEIIRQAGTAFMRMPQVAMKDKSTHPDLFEQFNLVSTSTYEGAEGAGRMVLANPDEGFMEFSLKFADPIPFHDLRGFRKTLQMSSTDLMLLADCEKILGLGRVARANGEERRGGERVFEVEFVGHHHWRLRCGDEVLLDCRNGAPSLLRDSTPDHLEDTYRRLFPGAEEVDVRRFLDLFEEAAHQGRGSMLVVAEDAKDEAERLQGLGAVVEPVVLTSHLYRQASRIDGAILVDPCGFCHAVGVILDGMAQPECTSSRGARYNSGVRYVYSKTESRLAIVVSDDGMVDVIPEPRPRVSREEIEEAVVALETACLEDGRNAANLVDRLRFYLNKEQCVRASRVIERLKTEILEAEEIWFAPDEFERHPRLVDSHFREEGP